MAWKMIRLSIALTILRSVGNEREAHRKVTEVALS